MKRKEPIPDFFFYPDTESERSDSDISEEQEEKETFETVRGRAAKNMIENYQICCFDHTQRKL